MRDMKPRPVFPPLPLPKLEWKWPLTHTERIEQLTSLLTMEQLEPTHNNIRAAIDYHRGFPADELCSTEEVNFSDGKRIDSLDEIKGSWWMEVMRAPFCPNYIPLT
jgi:hypothetical protein